jgi:PAS domain S-box-containing protein
MTPPDGLELLAKLPTLVEVGGALAAIWGGWVAWLRWVWPKFKGTGRALAGLMELGTRAGELTDGLGRMSAIEESLAAVKHEVLPNGGGSLRDAVARTEASVSLFLSQQRARDDAEDEVVRIDIDETGRVTWVAAALTRWTERTSDELRGHGWLSFIHPDEREDVAEEYTRCIRHKRQFDSAFRLIDRSGESTIVRMSTLPVTIVVGGREETRWTAIMKRRSNIPEALAAPERAPVQSRAP